VIGRPGGRIGWNARHGTCASPAHCQANPVELGVAQQTLGPRPSALGHRQELGLFASDVLLMTDGVFHGVVTGIIDIAPVRALHAGLALLGVTECVSAGRVIPAFTMSALPGLKLNVPRGLEQATLGTMAAGMALWVLARAQAYTAMVLGAAALLHAQRLWRWKPLRSRTPDPLGAAWRLCLAADQPRAGRAAPRSTPSASRQASTRWRWAPPEDSSSA
jgi:hypothetical protein